MLVYVNSFLFEPEPGPDQIIQLVAKWVGLRAAKSYVDAELLAQSMRELKLKDGSALSSRATLADDKQRIYPFWFCAQLSHRDDRISGRRWITEVGLRQESVEKPVECSVLLKTDEVSARVTAPIQVTRPRLVQQLVESCKPIGETPRLKVKELTLESASAFLREVERDQRDFPLVVLSAGRNDSYPVDPERLRSIVAGLAEVVSVRKQVDTFALEEIVGRRYMAFGGAINIVFPGRHSERGRFFETVLFRADDIDQLQDDGKSTESEVLAAITHRTNMPMSWCHISSEKVAQAVLRARLAETIARAKAGDNSQHLSEYVALLESADEELKAKDEELARSRSEYEVKAQEVRALELLQKLATDYWQQLADGKGDQQAKTVFGSKAYAANEANTLSNEGKRRRTFMYQDREFLMDKHLKYGVKDSVAETLRMHFEWLANEKKIIVGHCGKHLDF